MERRKTVLQAIRNGNQAKPLFVPERKQKESEEDADQEKGFHVEDPTENDQESILPISQELLLTENKDVYKRQTVKHGKRRFAAYWVRQEKTVWWNSRFFAHMDITPQ